MRDRVLDLVRDGVPDEEIAAVLTSEGHRSAYCPDKVPLITVQQIRRGAGIKPSAPRNRWTHDPRLLTAPELAARLNIPVNWLYVQIRQKRLLLDQQPTGAYLFQDAPAVLDAIRACGITLSVSSTSESVSRTRGGGINMRDRAASILRAALAEISSPR
jgi:hypothetical protein